MTNVPSGYLREAGVFGLAMLMFGALSTLTVCFSGATAQVELNTVPLRILAAVLVDLVATIVASTKCLLLSILPPGCTPDKLQLV